RAPRPCGIGARPWHSECRRVVGDHAGPLPPSHEPRAAHDTLAATTASLATRDSVSVRATAFVTCVAASRECAVHEDHGHDPTWGRARGMGKTSRALAG